MPKYRWISTKFRFHQFIVFILPLAMLAISSATVSADAAKRIALVIGNAKYENASPLKNPKNDAVDISEKLTELGFTVIGGFDLTRDAMQKKIREFSRALVDADISLFFYAGHAMQVNGRNFLAPIDTELVQEEDLDFETVPMDLIQKQMERNTKTALIFLDACRNNPLTRSMYSKSRSKGKQGLAELKGTVEGTLIAFSTQPTNVALDGVGRNSPFTEALLANIGRPNVEIGTMMTDVRRQVHQITNKQQTPWLNSSLLGRFYFVGGEQTQVASLETPQPVITSQNSAPQATRSTSNQDQIAAMTMQKMAWESIQNSNSESMYKAYIDKYKGSFFADLAKAKLSDLKKNQTQKETQVASLENPANPSPAALKPAQTAAVNEDRSINTGQLQPQLRDTDVTFRIQTSLKSFGCSPGRPDGKWGRNSNRALDSFARYSGLSIISFKPSVALMEQLDKFAVSGRNTGRICPAPVIRKRTVNRRVNRNQQRRNNNNGAAVQNFLGGVVGGIIACKLGGC